MGVAAGLIGAAWLARSLGSLLFGVPSTDPATYAAAGILLGLVAIVAAGIPAWRAAGVDPAVVLRDE
jgi:ABC-type antimicrobial peptide transport system permease subunit